MYFFTELRKQNDSISFPCRWSIAAGHTRIFGNAEQHPDENDADDEGAEKDQTKRWRVAGFLVAEVKCNVHAERCSGV